MKVDLRNCCELLVGVRVRNLSLIWILVCLYFIPAVVVAQGGLHIIGHTDPIQIFVNVVAEDGSPIGGLAANAFNVNENGISVTDLVTTVTSAADSNEIFVYVMDYSSSIAASVAFMEAAVLNAISLMDNNDQAAVIKFNRSRGVSIVQELTGDQSLLSAAVSSPYLVGDTNLYDAISVALGVFAGHTGTKAMIVLTDGRDNASNITLANLSMELENSNVPVFTVGLGDLIDDDLLHDLSDITGGVNYLATNPEELDGIYESISNRLKSEYTLTYSTAITACGAQTIDVTVNTTEGDKVYSGTFERCFPQVIGEKPIVRRKTGGGAINVWEMLAMSLLLVLIFVGKPRVSMRS